MQDKFSGTQPEFGSSKVPHIVSAQSPSDEPTGASPSDKSALAEKKDRMVDKAREKAADAGSKGKELLTEQKAQLADRIGGYGDAVQRAAHRMDSEQDAAFAHYARRAADELGKAADYLREREFSELRHDAEGLARRHQDVFLTGMFFSGLAVARFLKARPDRRI